MLLTRSAPELAAGPSEFSPLMEKLGAPGRDREARTSNAAACGAVSHRSRWAPPLPAYSAGLTVFERRWLERDRAVTRGGYQGTRGVLRRLPCSPAGPAPARGAV